MVVGVCDGVTATLCVGVCDDDTATLRVGVRDAVTATSSRRPWCVGDLVGLSVALGDLVGVACGEGDVVGLRVDAPDLVGLRVDAPDLVGLRVAGGDFVTLTGMHAPHVVATYPSLHTPEKKGAQVVYPTGQEWVGVGVLVPAVVVDGDTTVDTVTA